MLCFAPLSTLICSQFSIQLTQKEKVICGDKSDNNFGSIVMKGAMYESLLLSRLPPSVCIPPPLLAPQLTCRTTRQSPLVTWPLSDLWAVSNRICSGLMSLTTQRCKPHTHLATRCDTMAIRKRMLRRSTPPKQQASNANDDYRLPTPTEITSIFCI